MDMYANFKSQSNKHFLWNLMIESKLVQPYYKVRDVQNIFERLMDTIQSQSIESKNENITLIDLNKQFIQQLVFELNKYKEHIERTDRIETTKGIQLPNKSPVPQSQTTRINSNHPQYQQQQHLMIQGQSKPPSIPNNQQGFQSKSQKSDILEKKQQLFTQTLERKRQELEQALHTQPSMKIDFRDPLDEPLGSKMDELLERTLKAREQELGQIFPESQSQSSSSSIRNENDTKKQKKSVSFQENIPMTPIGTGTEIETEYTYKPEMTSNSSNSSNSFLSLFKTSMPTPNPTQEAFNEYKSQSPPRLQIDNTIEYKIDDTIHVIDNQTTQDNEIKQLTHLVFDLVEQVKSLKQEIQILKSTNFKNVVETT
jgi:hypothetical protein